MLLSLEFTAVDINPQGPHCQVSIFLLLSSIKDFGISSIFRAPAGIDYFGRPAAPAPAAASLAATAPNPGSDRGSAAAVSISDSEAGGVPRWSGA